MTQRIDELIAEIQMLALALGTQTGAEERRVILYTIREKTWDATSEVTLNEPRPAAPKRIPVYKFGVNDL